MDPSWIGYFIKKIIKFDIWMVLIFNFEGQLLEIKSRRELKENAIPILFDHAPLPKKSRMSIDWLQNQINRQIIEDVLFQAPEESKKTLVFQQWVPTVWEFVKLIRPLITLLKWGLVAHNTVLIILSENYWFHQKSQCLFQSKFHNIKKKQMQSSILQFHF